MSDEPITRALRKLLKPGDLERAAREILAMPNLTKRERARAARLLARLEAHRANKNGVVS